MKENRFERRTNEQSGQPFGVHRHTSRKWVGLFLLITGALFLARESGLELPRWLFTWPMLLIGFGLLTGIRHNFRGFGWLIPILIGGFFLVDRLSPELRIRPYIWPVALIAVGLVFLLRPKKEYWLTENDNVENAGEATPMNSLGTQTKNYSTPTNDGSDVIDATAIFGGIKKNVLSKNFRGGDITTFMGGAEINLTQADGNGRITIDCFNMFGGTKLIVPADWNIQSEIVTIFGGIEDKRPPANSVNPTKVLVLDGTCIFGGVEIKSY